MKIANFRREHPEVMDAGLDEALAKELPGIFNWAVVGLKDLVVSGGFITPKTSRELWTEYKGDANPAGQFLADNYRYDPVVKGEPTSKVYGEYREWCAENGYRPLSHNNFGREIHRTHPRVEKTRHRVAGKFVPTYSGLSKV